jgi:hypothetical protein
MASMPHALSVRRLPLAAVFASTLGVATHCAWAAPAVTNCNDGGDGSLRAAVVGAADGDLIDMSALQCSVITLQNGAIGITQNNLTLSGPGADLLELRGASAQGQGVLAHYGTGTLAIDHLAITSGKLYMSSSGKYFGGGCIGSFGNLTLSYAKVSGCVEFLGDNAAGRGAAVFAAGNLGVSHSTISGNTFGRVYDHGPCYYRYRYGSYYLYCTIGALSSPASARGGGLFAAGAMTVEHSTIAGNSANDGGGIYAAGSAELSFSSIEGNYATGTGAGLGTAGTGKLTITASTLSGNEAQPGFFSFASTIEGRASPGATPQPIQILDSTLTGNGGVAVVKARGPLAIYNSTIARNTGVYGFGSDGISAVSIADAPLTVVSSIIAENVGEDVTLSGTATIDGDHDLIDASSATLPPGTLSGCAGLEPLADNGGPTKTMSLRATSAAMDMGANPLDLPTDQRGTGYSRPYGVTDIGAFEAQGSSEDGIFSAAFETGPGACVL